MIGGSLSPSFDSLFPRGTKFNLFPPKEDYFPCLPEISELGPLSVEKEGTLLTSALFDQGDQ